MSTKKRTYVAFVLDASASMDKIREETISGVNSEIDAILEMKKEDPNHEIFVSFVTFNTLVYEHLWNEPIEKLAKITENDYVPADWTALIDAWGYTVDKLRKTTDVKDKNNAYLVKIITDGQENISKHFKWSHIKELMSACPQQPQCPDGNWTVSILGCSKDYLENICDDTKISRGNCAIWNSTSAPAASYGYTKSLDNTRSFLRARSSGLVGTETLCCTSVNTVGDYTQIDPQNNGQVKTVANVNDIYNTFINLPTSSLKCGCNSMFKNKPTKVDLDIVNVDCNHVLLPKTVDWATVNVAEYEKN